jgi:hypothetical protein
MLKTPFETNRLQEASVLGSRERSEMGVDVERDAEKFGDGDVVV